MSEKLKEHVEEKEEFEEHFEELMRICEQTELMTEAKRSLEETLARSSRKDDRFIEEETERQTGTVCEK